MSEIARMARVSRQAVGNWRARHADFPRPHAVINSAPAFSRIEVEAWLRQRGIETRGESVAEQIKRSTRVLRQFLYCNQRLVRDFLAQSQGGAYESEDVTETTEGSRTLEGGVAAGPLTLKGGAGRETTREKAQHIQQVMASEFQRLYSLLERDGMIAPLYGFDDAIWDGIQPMEFIEVPVVIQLPGFHQIGQLASAFGELIPRLERRGLSPEIPADAALAMQAMSDLYAATEEGPLAVIASATGNAKVTFLCRLERQWLDGDGQELEGEATILAKVQRKLQRGEHASAVDLPVLRGFSAKKRREFDKIFDKPKIEGLEVGGSSVSYPGAVLTVIGIYR